MARKQQNPTPKKSAPQRSVPQDTAEQVASGRAELVPDRDRPNAWTLLLDGTPQSHVDLDDPTRLSFEYQRRFGHLVDLAAAPRQPITALHLGGGALTLARYVAATRPRSRQQVAEIDTALTEFVRRTLPLDRGWQLRVRGGDAREILARSPEAQADLVVADIFAPLPADGGVRGGPGGRSPGDWSSGARTPAHCASVEFARLAARALRPEGRYAVNITDGGRLDFARGQVATLREAFAEVALIADPVVLRGRRFGNLVLVAAQQPLPLERLTRLIATDQHPGRMEHGPGLTDFQAGAVPVPDAGAGPSPAPPPGAFTV